MNGVPQKRASLVEQQYTFEQLRSMKQNFLMENVLNCGYDPTEFAEFMEYKMGKSELSCLQNYAFPNLSVLFNRGWNQCWQLGVWSPDECRVWIPGSLPSRWLISLARLTNWVSWLRQKCGKGRRRRLKESEWWPLEQREWLCRHDRWGHWVPIEREKRRPHSS